MTQEHYYLVIGEHHISEIQQAESPIRAIDKTSWPGYNFLGDAGDEGPRLKDAGCKWRAFEGRADHHYICYQFHFSGPMTGRVANVVDLGPTTAYDAPGLPSQRMNPAVACPLRDGPCPRL